MVDTRRERSSVVTRRRALSLAGAATVLACAGTGRWSAALAQEASPVASPVGDGSLVGAHVVIRIRTVKPDRSADELLTMIQDGFVPLIAEIPGLVWYVAGANPETRLQFSVGVYEDAVGIEASNQLAAEWGALGASDFVEGDPEIHAGVIGVAAEPALAGDMAGRYLVIRLREPSPDQPVAEVMRLIGEGYVPLVREIPGFRAYFGSADGATGTQAYVGVFDDLGGAEESTRIAGEWLRENDYTFFVGDPIVAEGEIGAATSSAA